MRKRRQKIRKKIKGKQTTEKRNKLRERQDSINEEMETEFQAPTNVLLYIIKY